METPDAQGQTCWPLADLKRRRVVEYGGREIDPVKYGVLWQRVQDMDKKMDKVERQLEELCGSGQQVQGRPLVLA